jgi:hypothetical protein
VHLSLKSYTELSPYECIINLPVAALAAVVEERTLAGSVLRPEQSLDDFLLVVRVLKDLQRALTRGQSTFDIMVWILEGLRRSLATLRTLSIAEE